MIFIVTKSHAAAVVDETPVNDNNILVTCADGPEGFVMASSLLVNSKGMQFNVVAAVEDMDSPAAQTLERDGAELRKLNQPMDQSVFKGISWMFLLAPLTVDRLERASSWIDGARAGGVKKVAMLSVMGASAHVSGAFGAYYQLELLVASTWASDEYVILRTAFYQENLLFWAADTRGTGILRLPLKTNECFAPLHNADVAAVVAFFAVERAPLSMLGQTLDLTGPEVLSGERLAFIATSSLPQPGLKFESVNRTMAQTVLEKTHQLDKSEVDLIIDLLVFQSGHGSCNTKPSHVIESVLGRPAIGVVSFFTDNAEAFTGVSIDMDECSVCKVVVGVLEKSGAAVLGAGCAVACTPFGPAAATVCAKACSAIIDEACEDTAGDCVHEVCTEILGLCSDEEELL